MGPMMCLRMAGAGVVRGGGIQLYFLLSPRLGPSNHLATVHCTVTVPLYITWHTSDRWSHNAWE